MARRKRKSDIGGKSLGFLLSLGTTALIDEGMKLANRKIGPLMDSATYRGIASGAVVAGSFAGHVLSNDPLLSAVALGAGNGAVIHLKDNVMQIATGSTPPPAVPSEGTAGVGNTRKWLDIYERGVGNTKVIPELRQGKKNKKVPQIS